MTFESSLNLVWVTVAISALALLTWSETHRRAFRAPLSRFRRLFSVVLAVLFLFPCVSESDDLLSLGSLQLPPETRGEIGSAPSQRSEDDSSSAQVRHWLNELQAFASAAAAILSVLLFCVALVTAPRAGSLERWLHAFSGRAPPCPVL